VECSALIDFEAEMRLYPRMRLDRFILAIFAAVAPTLAFTNAAEALVGNAEAAGDSRGARHAVLIVGSRGNACTGTAIARDLVLTAAHCVPTGADYKLVEFDAARRPTLKDVARVARHPQFSMQAFEAKRTTADVAVLKLAAPLPARVTPARIWNGDARNVKPGDRFIVSGFGVTVPGDGKSGGTLRTAELQATGKPGSLQIRLVDPATLNARAGLGACTGDSGAPAFVAGAGSLEVVGVVSWSTGPGNSAGCGGLTGVTPLTRYRAWIVETARKLGSPVGE
jgi:secreted trypsin-like serine protease